MLAFKDPSSGTGDGCGGCEEEKRCHVRWSGSCWVRMAVVFGCADPDCRATKERKGAVCLTVRESIVSCSNGPYVCQLLGSRSKLESSSSVVMRHTHIVGA